MIPRVLVTVVLAAVYVLLGIQGIPGPDDHERQQVNRFGMTAGRLAAMQENNVDLTQPVLPPVARYDEKQPSWTFTARVLRLQAVSIYGRPGTIAQVEYTREGIARLAWIVVRIDDYEFGPNVDTISEGQVIMLSTSGKHVSPHGVDWEACPPEDLYCTYASFVEGGFPISEDYNGHTVCPSNTLIYSGHVSDDWINGLLAWRIMILN